MTNSPNANGLKPLDPGRGQLAAIGTAANVPSTNSALHMSLHKSHALDQSTPQLAANTAAVSNFAR